MLPDQVIIEAEMFTDELIDDEPQDGQDVSEFDGDNLSDVEADAMTLASAGMGTDEDYGYFGGEDF